VGDVLRSLGVGDLDELLGDERPGDGGAQGVDVLVEGVGLEGGPDVVGDELLGGVDEVGLDSSVPESAGDDVVLAGGLTDVDRDGDDVDVVLFLEPVDRDGGVES